jgi:hypothetical protein
VKKPRRLWGAAVNLSGLYASKPLLCTLDVELGEWFDSEGDFSVHGVGEVRKPGIITFGSETKMETQRWIDGVRAAMDMLNLWCGR